jgi:hypothetical protein
VAELDQQQRALEGVKIATEVIKQMITLAAGTLALSGSIAGIFFKQAHVEWRYALLGVWGCLLLSLLLGLFALGGFVAMFQSDTAKIDPEHKDASNLAKVQQVSLFVGLFILAAFGAANVWANDGGTPASSAPTIDATATPPSSAPASADPSG